MSPTTRRQGLRHIGPLPTLCTYLQPWRSKAHGLRSFRTCTTTQQMHLEGRYVPCKQYCASGLQQHIICTENVTAVRYTLQRLQMCSRATIASSTWNKYQLIDNFYSPLAASICCHRGRCGCDTVIHACTRGLSLNEKIIHACAPGLSFFVFVFNFCVRSSGARPRRIAKDCCCG